MTKHSVILENDVFGKAVRGISEHNLMASCSWTPLNLEDEVTMFLLQVRDRLPGDTALYPRGKE